MTLLCINQSKLRMPRVYLQNCVEQVVAKLKRKGFARQLKDKQLVIVFLDPKEAKRLNHQYRSKKYATDVLSFLPIEQHSLGELVLCPQVLKKQALEHDLTFRDELCYMVLHGILHLLGFDHERSEAEARRMFRLQDEIFESL